MNETDITEFVEPVFRFCLNRLNNRYDAEDLASEIMVHVLNGLSKYKIDSLEGWVWRIAHNRYARFIRSRKVYQDNENSVDNDFLVTLSLSDDYDIVDAIEVEDNFSDVFRYLHTLSKDYRDITVDYYIGEMCVRDIAEKYSLAETTVKWRLNVSREKIKKRIGENKMEKIYKRLNWNTTSCNGSMDSDKYLHSQIARAICEAAYEKPVTVEEISLKTGLPTIFIEDELPKLIYGDAIVDEGNGKYSTNFIILRLSDREMMEKNFAPIVKDIADFYQKLFVENSEKIKSIGFTGCDKKMNKLGYIALPASLRNKIGTIKSSVNMENGPYPPRKDGRYGWFVVDEFKVENGTQITSDYGAGCNSDKNNDTDGWLHYYWLAKYFRHDIYRHGMGCIVSKNIMDSAMDGRVPSGVFTEDDIAKLIKYNLAEKSGDGYKFTFACFTREQFAEFTNAVTSNSEALDSLLKKLILDIHSSFKQFVPKRLDSQINQWVSCFVNEIIGYVAEELINRNVLETPDEKTPMTNGIFYIPGKYMIS